MVWGLVAGAVFVTVAAVETAVAAYVVVYSTVPPPINVLVVVTVAAPWVVGLPLVDHRHRR